MLINKVATPNIKKKFPDKWIREKHKQPVKVFLKCKQMVWRRNADGNFMVIGEMPIKTTVSTLPDQWCWFRFELLNSWEKEYRLYSAPCFLHSMTGQMKGNSKWCTAHTEWGLLIIRQDLPYPFISHTLRTRMITGMELSSWMPSALDLNTLLIVPVLVQQPE